MYDNLLVFVIFFFQEYATMLFKQLGSKLLRISGFFFVPLGVCLSFSSFSYALNKEPAYQIFKVSTSVKSLMEEEKAEFFKIEKQKYKLIEEKAKQAYLDAFWDKQGEKYKSSSENAKVKYMEENARVTKKEIDSRKIGWQPPQKKYRAGVLAKYACLAKPASQGAHTMPTD